MFKSLDTKNLSFQKKKIQQSFRVMQAMSKEIITWGWKIGLHSSRV